MKILLSNSTHTIFMKTTTFATAAVAIASFLPALGFSETVNEIVNKFERQKAEALAEYVKTATGSEKADALEHLAGAYAVLGEDDRLIPLLEQRYEALDKGADADLQSLIGGVVQPLVDLYSAAGQKDKAIALLDQASGDLNAHPQGEQITGFLGQLKGKLNQPSVGDTMNISFTDALGAGEIDLAETYKGKVVLVDFWATWCGPCVAELPHVIDAYTKHKDAGFEVVGISLDKDLEAMKQFCAENGMTWPQAFDGKGWQNAIAQEFEISGIPATFLIGRDGKIAATNLRGEALGEKVAELLEPAG